MCAERYLRNAREITDAHIDRFNTGGLYYPNAMRRHDYQARTDIEFGANTTAGTLTQEESKELKREMEHRHADPACRVEVSIETNRHSLDGVVEEWGLNYPNFLFADGSRGFISQSDDADGIRLLFKDSYHGPSAPRYKYPVEEFEASIYWHQTPDCPVCGDSMTYGMVNWDVHDPDGFMSGWLCENEIPARVEEGVR